ncbi:hypothetical protein [uncultured Psychroserpens sp.]|uniref:hypothetical protein n=1 Tax=uncultured Psychroserpens sp. TaxID=255436 RepID=UPI00262AEDBE|nr:hypothetical protein [uncultured Psychroserpens sp.]
MSDTNSRKSFWWYFIRVTILTIVFFAAVLLLSDFNHTASKRFSWDVNDTRFWLGALLYFGIAFGFLSLITALVMKISKLTQ